MPPEADACGFSGLGSQTKCRAREIWSDADVARAGFGGEPSQPVEHRRAAVRSGGNSHQAVVVAPKGLLFAKWKGNPATLLIFAIALERVAWSVVGELEILLQLTAAHGNPVLLRI